MKINGIVVRPLRNVVKADIAMYQMETVDGRIICRIAMPLDGDELADLDTMKELSRPLALRWGIIHKGQRNVK